jgi:hypothetical protein
MAEVLDITKTELSEQLTKIDLSVKTWWDAAPSLPTDVPMTEFLIKILTCTYMAQVKKNLAAGTLQPGEALNSYRAPINTLPVLDPDTGMQIYSQTCTVVGFTTSDSNRITNSTI